MTDYAAAAAALGVPEAILRRSAEARAQASGVTVDDLLTAWAGGETVVAAPPAAPPTEAPADAPPAADAPSAPPSPAPAPAVPSLPTEPPVAVRRAVAGTPPVLVGVSQSINGVALGALGILILSVLLAFVVPSLPQPGNGVRTSNHAFTQPAIAGQEMYLQQGCASCHTQLIRAVVADAKLGPVTLADSNQVLGYRRIGPDLGAIGARAEDTAALAGLLRGSDGHPAVTGLSDEALTNLLAYLREST